MDIVFNKTPNDKPEEYQDIAIVWQAEEAQYVGDGCYSEEDGDEPIVYFYIEHDDICIPWSKVIAWRNVKLNDISEAAIDPKEEKS